MSRSKNLITLLFILLLLSCVLLISPFDALAVPAPERLHTLTQSNGYIFQGRQWGDEFYSGWETKDGLSIVFDNALKSWTYAVNDDEGNLISSSLIVGVDEFPQEMAGKIRLHGKTLSRIRQKRALKQGIAAKDLSAGKVMAPQTGTKNVLVILVNFSDTTTKYAKSDFQSAFFGTGNKSLVDFYKEISYNKLTVSPGPGGIADWVTVSKTHNYYGANQGSENKDVKVGELIYEAVKAVDGRGFDFSPYDQDNDCYVDTVAVIFQGEDETVSGNSNDIWPHQSSIDDYTTNSDCSKGGKIKISKYTAQAEQSGEGQLATIGTMAHEYGHALGLPDLYDTDYSSGGVGQWTLMSGGTDNKVLIAGDRPAHLDPWCKYYLGWVTPTEVTGSLSAVSLYPVENSPVVYKLLSGNETSGEYFLVENRQKTGFDEGLPGSGMLIWHIDGSTISINMSENKVNNSECYSGGISCASQHYGVGLVQADNLWNLEKNVNSGDYGDPFPGSSNNTFFSDSSSPDSKLYSGTSSGVSITDISVSGDIVTANFSVSGGGTGCQSATLSQSGSSYSMNIPVLLYSGSYYSLGLNLTLTEKGILAQISSISVLGSDSAGCVKATLDSSLKLSVTDLAYSSLHFSVDFQLRISNGEIYMDILSASQVY